MSVCVSSLVQFGLQIGQIEFCVSAFLEFLASFSSISFVSCLFHFGNGNLGWMEFVLYFPCNFGELQENQFVSYLFQQGLRTCFSPIIGGLGLD